VHRRGDDCGAEQNDSGKFLVFSAGQQLGVETFTIRNDETAESADTLNISNNTINFKTATAYKTRIL
jgi:hypothetical protein